MKNSIFLSSLLAVCVTCVAHAEIIETETLVKSGNKEYEESLTTNRLQIGDSGGKGTVTVKGTTTINPNHPGDKQPNACQIQAGSTLVSDSVVFHSKTAAWAKTFYIYGTVKTNNFTVSAEDGYKANVQFQNKGTIISSSEEAGTGSLVIGKNGTVKAGSYGGYAANAGYIKVNTEVNNGGTLQVYQNANIEGDIILNGGIVSIESTFAQNANLTLQEIAIISDVTMNSGELNILGDVQTGALTLNGGTINFDADATIDLGEESLILGDKVAITLNVDSLDNSEGITLFKNVSNVTGLDALTVTVKDATGATKEAAVSFSNGSVVTSNIPEPTTATLSLLALAGLAARRRRASR